MEHCIRRRGALAAALVPLLGRAADAASEADPHRSLVWPDLQREFLGASARVRFDTRVEVLAPAFAEDPMNVPATVRVQGLPGVRRVLVLVDRNPIRKVLDFEPLDGAAPSVGLRFKLEQASPVRAAVLAGDGVWHVGSALVDSAGGGCTASGATRADGSWSSTLGQGQAKVYGQSPVPGSAARLRLRVMHPMDTGLVAGVPAFYLNRLSVRDADGRELARLQAFEPVSENPVFTFDFARPPKLPLSITGTDNNGNRIALSAGSAMSAP